MSSIQGLLSTRTRHLGLQKVSCLWRCPQFIGPHNKFHYIVYDVVEHLCVCVCVCVFENTSSMYATFSAQTRGVKGRHHGKVRGGNAGTVGVHH